MIQDKPSHTRSRTILVWILRTSVILVGIAFFLVTFWFLISLTKMLVMGRAVVPINYLVLVILFVISYTSVYSGISSCFRKPVMWMMLGVLILSLFGLWLTRDANGFGALVWYYFGSIAGLCLIASISTLLWVKWVPVTGEKPDYKRLLSYGFIFFICLCVTGGGYGIYTKRQNSIMSAQRVVRKSMPSDRPSMSTVEQSATSDIKKSVGTKEAEPVLQPEEDNFPQGIQELQRQEREWRERDLSDTFRFEQAEGYRQSVSLYTPERNGQMWVPETIRQYIAQHMPKEIVTDVAKIGEGDWLFISNPQMYTMSRINRLYKDQFKQVQAEGFSQLICLYGLNEIRLYQDNAELKVSANCMRYEGTDTQPSIFDRWRAVWRDQQFVTEERYTDTIKP